MIQGISRRHWKRIREAEHEITRLEKMGLAYGFGGGRNCGTRPCRYATRPANGVGGDCSWGALVVCDVLGVDIKDWLGSTYSLATEGKPGRGKCFTLHIKNPPDPHEAHVIMSFHHPLHTRWAEVGGVDNPQPGDGFTYFRPTEARIKEFPILRHFEGF